MNLKERPVCVGDKFEIEIEEVIETDSGNRYLIKGFGNFLTNDYVMGNLKRIEKPEKEEESCDGLDMPFPEYAPDRRYKSYSSNVGHIVRLTNKNTKDVLHGIILSENYSPTLESYVREILFSNGEVDSIALGKHVYEDFECEVTPFHTDAVAEAYEYLKQFEAAMKYFEGKSE